MDAQKFLKRLDLCGLLSDRQIAEFLARLEPAQQISVPELSSELVKTGLLNSWQVEELRAGRDRLLIGKYPLIGRLGGGGMGVVYLAEHKLLKKKVALKVISDDQLDNQHAVERFLREGRVLAQLKHPSIVAVHDLDQTEAGTFFLAMEYIEGRNLAEFVRDRGVLGADFLVEIARQVAAGLDHAYQFGIVHRDLKPHNFMIDRQHRPIVLDMGLAVIRNDRVREQLSCLLVTSQSVLGTPAYMAPEQFVGGHVTDSRSDIYSLGCTLYFALTARPPFVAKDLLELRRQHEAADPVPLTQTRRDVPESLIRIINRMMAKRPDDRYQSPAELLEELRLWKSTSASVPEPLGKPLPLADSHAPTLPPRESAPSSGPQPARLLHLSGFSLEMMHVPAGPFPAGCTPEMARAVASCLPVSQRDEGCQALLRNPHRLAQTDEYLISKFPITRAQYQRFLAATGYPRPPEWADQLRCSEDGDRPVVQVSLADARAFCEWAGLSLPTSDEWEKAARGTDGRLYPWGSTFDPARCHCDEAGASEPSPVNAFPTGASPFGVEQACGNVWEWVDSGQEVPAVRGGSYQSICEFFGAVFHFLPAEPSVRREHIGFRVVQRSRSPEPPARRAPRRRASRAQVADELAAQLIAIPAGPFIRGLNRFVIQPLIDRFGLGESDIHKLVDQGSAAVSLPAFAISRYCVTNGQYLAYVQAERAKLPEGWDSAVVEASDPVPAWCSLPVAGIAYDL
jgi:serine/threonine protein kinase